MSEPLVPGFYGKLPGLGDFVSRRLPRTFIDPWDSWLQAAFASSRRQLGESWLDIYLTSPIWRFALAPRLAGEDGWTGAVVPSVDRVGRYFPATVAARLEDGPAPFRIPGHFEAWFARVEARLLEALDDEEALDMEAFDAALRATVLPATAPRESVFRAPSGPAPAAWRIGLEASGAVESAYPDLLDALAEAGSSPYSIWWTRGSEWVAPSLLVCYGLPPVDGYAAMLGGEWQAFDWHDGGLHPALESSAPAP
jgi:type VI secretion system protein ImpM